jgi:hypothetical protein
MPITPKTGSLFHADSQLPAIWRRSPKSCPLTGVPQNRRTAATLILRGSQEKVSVVGWRKDFAVVCAVSVWPWGQLAIAASSNSIGRRLPR